MTRRGERGSAIGETVVVTPLVLLLLVAFIEVGRYAEYSVRVANAARAGAQFAGQNLSFAGRPDLISAAVTADSASAPNLTVASKVYCTCADGSNADCFAIPPPCSANHKIVYAEVDVTGTLKALVGFPGLPANLASISVTRNATVRVAQ